MIVKKVSNPKHSKSKQVRIEKLTDYIRAPEKENGQEKCMHAGGVNFISEHPNTQQEEMIALASVAKKSQDPINHYVLSFREGEVPSKEQTDEAVKIFLQEMNWKEHQAIYGLHKDTDNLHIHIAINRVHPDTEKTVNPNKGFDIRAAHKAIAVIEHEQGWSQEKNARYQVEEKGKVVERKKDPEKDNPSHPKQLIKAAKSWQELHQNLQKEGMRYFRKGNGACVLIGNKEIKASSVDRKASLGKLQKRLGPYQEPAKVREPEGRERERRIEFSQEKTRKAKELLDKERRMKERHKEEQILLRAAQKEQRQELLRGHWTGSGNLLNAMRAEIAKEQKQERDNLKAKHSKEKMQLVREKSRIRTQEYVPQKEKVAAQEMEQDGGRERTR